MALEVEQKFRVSDHDAVRRKIVELGAGAAGAVSQCDTYFAHPSREFVQTGEVMRVRSTDKGAFLTYKGAKLDQVVKTRREIELPIGDTSLEFKELLEALGFTPITEVRKRRERFHLIHGKVAIEIALDTVDEVGSFVEVEAIAQHDDLNQAKEAVVQVAEQLGLSELEGRSYLRMLLASRE